MIFFPKKWVSDILKKIKIFGNKFGTKNLKQKKGIKFVPKFIVEF